MGVRSRDAGSPIRSFAAPVALAVSFLVAVGCNVDDPLTGEDSGSDRDTGRPTVDTSEEPDGGDDTETPGGDGGVDATDTLETGTDDTGGDVEADGVADTTEDTIVDTSADTGRGDTGPSDTGAGGDGSETGTDACSPSAEMCNGVDDDCDGVVDEFCPCDYTGTSGGVCSEATRTVTGKCAQPSGYESPESSCDGKDNDCDGQTDESLSSVLLAEDFEGTDPLGWGKVPSGHNDLKVDDDIQNGLAPEGSEHAAAWYRHGPCVNPAGIGASKTISGTVDEISVQISADVDAWGRVAIFIRDSAGNTTMLWRANASGGGYDTNGWKTLQFDQSTSFMKTSSSGAKIRQKAIPSGITNEKVTLIFGSDDDGSYCTYSDHGWRLRVDDLEVRDTCN